MTHSAKETKQPKELVGWRVGKDLKKEGGGAI